MDNKEIYYRLLVGCSIPKVFVCRMETILIITKLIIQTLVLEELLCITSTMEQEKAVGLPLYITLQTILTQENL